MIGIKHASIALFVGIFLPLASPNPDILAAATPDSSASPGTAPASTLPGLPAATTQSDNTASLQSRMRATTEEWNIIYPKIQHITMLRDEVHAGIAQGPANRGRGMFNSPLGGTSLDAPTLGNMGIAASLIGGGQAPFDPKSAPGLPGANGRSATPGLGGLMAGADMFKTSPGGSVPALLAELQSLVSNTAAPEEQIRQKMAEVRAARARAAQDLERSQQDLIPLLTIDQVAILVLLDLMD